ncbi:MAG: type IX secretion system protein PorQ [Prevotellaceae bacterium]|jgi:hypothetical protein|nr:type IX secretion system protein PorQ [Prevotellaceae bacterium]
MRKLFTLLFFVSTLVSLYGQAGKGVYQFLNLPVDARSVGFGGINVSTKDGDINLGLNNPALLDSVGHNMLSLNYSNYLAGINYGSVAYGRTFKSKNHWAVGISYLDYGKTDSYDETDVYQGDFSMKDIVINLAYNRTLNKYFSAGAIIKPLYSAYERYTSAGIGFDFGLSYHNDSIQLDLGLAVKNAGWQFNGYYSENDKEHREPLPWNILFGISKRFKHAPIRLSLTLHNLQTWNLYYERSSELEKEYQKPLNIKWYDMLFRHTIISAEIIPIKNFFLVVSFNCRRRAEMAVPDFKSLAGFSFGAGIKIRQFNAGFALTSYQKGVLSYNFTVSTNFSEFGLK